MAIFNGIHYRARFCCDMFSWTLLQVRHFRLDNIERRDFRRDERINQMFLCFGVVCKPYNVYLQVQIQTYKMVAA